MLHPFLFKVILGQRLLSLMIKNRIDCQIYEKKFSIYDALHMDTNVIRGHHVYYKCTYNINVNAT